jgi:uncharacterized protein YdaU (DUF1376 family)
MTPIDPVDPKIATLQSLQDSKMQQSRRIAEEGMARHADELDKENNEEKTSVEDVNKSEGGKIDPESKNSNEQNKKKKKSEKSKKEENKETKEPHKGNLLDIKG